MLRIRFPGVWRSAFGVMAFSFLVGDVGSLNLVGAFGVSGVEALLLFVSGVCYLILGF